MGQKMMSGSGLLDFNEASFVRYAFSLQARRQNKANAIAKKVETSTTLNAAVVGFIHLAFQHGIQALRGTRMGVPTNDVI